MAILKKKKSTVNQHFFGPVSGPDQTPTVFNMFQAILRNAEPQSDTTWKQIQRADKNKDPKALKQRKGLQLSEH